MFIPFIQNNYINTEFRPQKNAIEESLQELIRISTQAITKNGRYQGCNQVVKFLLNGIKEYPKSNHPAEYLARIPQAATILAIRHPEYNAKMIEDIMMASIPNLYRFFIKDFIPASQNCLTKVSSPEIQIKI